MVGDLLRSVGHRFEEIPQQGLENRHTRSNESPAPKLNRRKVFFLVFLFLSDFANYVWVVTGFGCCITFCNCLVSQQNEERAAKSYAYNTELCFVSVLYVFMNWKFIRNGRRKKKIFEFNAKLIIRLIS